MTPIGRTEYEREEDPLALGKPFPNWITLTMYERYYCPEHRTEVRIAIKKATYSNPKVEDLT
jgi:hypothetical protein